ncbi:unnamed protein product [Didymodactylos carnosus]|uniref:LITAF domain-containing protein n=1 Tax=Didymodactylos carnosus TaxID=1234261 RepID=A0A816E1B6_9BILA|nr:unnamed protein product [Didymodactylos carnosus]CAF1643907.1 unnamed protein product [Didymodactylos carnosus]CAF4037245.1 unnamed protein product [Didymodactylos carnosus]CAF4560414.1 unnamed protein product [Didymodactylos carnosus]
MTTYVHQSTEQSSSQPPSYMQATEKLGYISEATTPMPPLYPLPSIQPIYGQVLHMVPMVILGDMPVSCNCGNCHASIITRTERTAGILTWLICGGLALFGCWLGCCLIPFCIGELQDTQHFCPNCAALIGTHKRM